jgi:coenzyme F420-0:L-glutamate ligase/coenzyme F420-1:gamma-L-glutamate ligase
VLQVWALPGIPEVTPGTDLVEVIADAVADTLEDGDILVVTSKIVSKAEGRIVKADDRDDAITAETVRVVATRTSETGHVTRIVQNRLGIVSAAAGVDASNTAHGTVLLLPEDPDASARREGARGATVRSTTRSARAGSKCSRICGARRMPRAAPSSSRCRASPTSSPPQQTW